MSSRREDAHKRLTNLLNMTIMLARIMFLLQKNNLDQISILTLHRMGIVMIMDIVKERVTFEHPMMLEVIVTIARTTQWA